jgi:hypothetical protein
MRQILRAAIQMQGGSLLCGARGLGGGNVVGFGQHAISLNFAIREIANACGTSCRMIAPCAREVRADARLCCR